MSTTPNVQGIAPVLVVAPPAELGVLRDRGGYRRHLAAAVLNLAARGYLRILDAGNDPDIGEALDWLLLLPGEQPSVSPESADTRMRFTPAASQIFQRSFSGDVDAESTAIDLRPHEHAVLRLIANTPTRLLSRVRASEDVRAVLNAMASDTGERGWLGSVAGIAISDSRVAGRAAQTHGVLPAVSPPSW